MPFETAAVEARRRAYPDLVPFLEALEDELAESKLLTGTEVCIARAPASNRQSLLRCSTARRSGDDSPPDVHSPKSPEIHVTPSQKLPLPPGSLSRWEGSAENLEKCTSAEDVEALFRGAGWARYVAGCFPVLRDEGYLRTGVPGCRILLLSDVPEGKGVSSSASLEVATMKALAAALELNVDDLTVALLCQKVENCIVGASCGVMDQMTAMMGRSGMLMKLLCQPHTLLGHVEIPEGLAVIGVDSGECHSISGSEYASVRTGTFMGRAILQKELGKDIQYLAELSPLDLQGCRPPLPDSMLGETFLSRYDTHGDAATSVEADKTYSVLLPTQHPVLEIERVRQFAAELEKAAPGCHIKLGALMHASHRAYQALGLDSRWTNVLYESTLDAAERGIFGGKISGGGSGGTVCILVSSHHKGEAIQYLKTLLNQERQCEEDPIVFDGSSDGAHAFGILRSCL